jgi:uncharacterized protein (DUF1778 family)
MYCHCEYMTTRDDRLQVRIDAAAKRRLEDAAGEVHLSVSAFVLQAAQERAEQVLAERELVRLSPRAAEVFSEALSRPAEVNKQLLDTLQRPLKFSWLD